LLVWSDCPARVRREWQGKLRIKVAAGTSPSLGSPVRSSSLHPAGLLAFTDASPEVVEDGPSDATEVAQASFDKSKPLGREALSRDRSLKEIEKMRGPIPFRTGNNSEGINDGRVRVAWESSYDLHPGFGGCISRVYDIDGALSARHV
jgi:hypothetical protein